MEESEVYLRSMASAIERLDSCDECLASYVQSRKITHLESAALQLRKTMETIAFATIAPNKSQYAAFRKAADKPADFRRDWQADTIFLALSKINPEFYPRPLTRQTRVGPNAWHFGHATDKCLSRASFEKLYKRLGKYLHADNPWSADKGWEALAVDLADATSRLRVLLLIHRTVIRSPEFNGVWIVEAPSDGTPPRMFRATSDGPFSTTLHV